MKTLRDKLNTSIMVFVMAACTMGCTNDRSIPGTSKKESTDGKQTGISGRDIPARNNISKEELKGGTLIGMVTRGPVSPVERNDTPTHSEPASDIKLVILTLPGQEITSVLTDSEGKYSVSLPPDSYRVEMPSLTRGFSKNLPATVTIYEGEETRLNVRIDTGIR